MCGPDNSSTCSVQIVLDPDIGIHMGLAGMLARIAGQFESDVMIEYNNARANAKSLIGIIMLGIAIREVRDFFNGFLAEKEMISQ